MPALVYHQVADLHPLVIATRWLAELTTTQEGLDSVFELARTERCCQIIVGAGFKSGDFVVEEIVRGEEKRRRLNAPVSDFFQQLDSGHLRHCDVQDKAVKAISCYRLQSRLAAFLFGDFKTESPKIFRQKR